MIICHNIVAIVEIQIYILIVGKVVVFLMIDSKSYINYLHKYEVELFN